jgi:2-methylcitrate dehydratase PrpD
MSLSGELSQWVLDRYRCELTPENLAHTLRHVGDFAAIAIAARESSPLARQVRHGLEAQGSEPSTSAKAFILSAYAHILDFDDVYDLGRVHPSSVIVPAALAACSLKPVRYSELLKAISAGSELLCRLALAWKPLGTGPGSDWFLTQLFGYFAGAATAGLILGLDRQQMQAALGLAYMQAAGGKEAGFGTNSNARAIYPAFAAMGGVRSVLLARSGLVGPPSALDGLAGFFPLYFGGQLTSQQRAILLDDTAEVWPETQMKPWPSCRHSHPFVQAASMLHEQCRSWLSPPSRVEIRVNQSAAKLCVPIEERRRPQTLQDAKYSVPFMVAFCLVHGVPTLLNLTAATLEDAAVLAIAAQVVVEPTESDEPGLPHACIAVQAAAGGPRLVFDDPYRSPDPAALLERKIRECLAYAGFPDAEIAAARRLLADDQAKDCGALLELMAVTPQTAQP